MRTLDPDTVAALEPIAAGRENGHRKPGEYRVTFDEKGRLTLPQTPAPSDLAGCCAWLTAAFNLNTAHPITGGAHEGLRGPDGHVVLYRLDAPPLRFEPAAKINTPARLIEALNWRMLPIDGAVHDLKGAHCREIAHVARMLCGAHGAMTDEQETAAVVGTYLQVAAPVEGCTTHGTPPQRYEAAVALRRAVDDVTGRAIGPPRYLIDANTGELVIAVSDLADTARRHIGGSLARGWLDARMQALGWARVTLDGHAAHGRSGRTSGHARPNVYRGHLPAVARDDEGTVTT